MAKPLRTKDVIALTKVGREALRFYENKGLIPQPQRSAAGYREYPPETIRRIGFIKVAQETGFTLKEIKEFLVFDNQKSLSRNFVLKTIDAKLLTVDQKIQSLQRIRGVLNNLRKGTEDQRATEVICPLLGKIKFK